MPKKIKVEKEIHQTMNDVGLNERNGNNRMDTNQVSIRVNPEPERLKNWPISVKPARGSAAAKR
jgi:hypothetical protein